MAHPYFRMHTFVSKQGLKPKKEAGRNGEGDACAVGARGGACAGAALWPEFCHNGHCDHLQCDHAVPVLEQVPPQYHRTLSDVKYAVLGPAAIPPNVGMCRAWSAAGTADPLS